MSPGRYVELPSFQPTNTKFPAVVVVAVSVVGKVNNEPYAAVVAFGSAVKVGATPPANPAENVIETVAKLHFA